MIQVISASRCFSTFSTLGKIPSLPFIVVGIFGVVGFATRYSNQWHLLSFAGGVTAALLVRFEWFCQLASKRISSFVLLASIGVTVILFLSPHAPVPLLLLSLSFALIAGENTMFGALSSEVSRTLGEMVYSIYLLHGGMLFVFFKFLVGFDRATLLSVSTHWLLVILMTPVLVSLCFVTFRFIERPAMQSTAAVTKWIRSILLRQYNSAAERENF